MERPVGGILTVRQKRIRTARRALAALGYQETITWSFIARRTATLFGGGEGRLVLANPIAADLDCMRPSILPGLIEALGRNAKRGFPGGALFEIGPVFHGDAPADQRTMITVVADPRATRRWDQGPAADLFTLKGDLMALLDELDAPTASLAVMEDVDAPWWRPGRVARLSLGAKNTLATFGDIHPRRLKALDVDFPVIAFEIAIESIPEPKAKATKTKPALRLSPLMPLTRDFAFVTPTEAPAGALTRAAQSADRALIADARIFDVYEGPGVEAGHKSVAIEVVIQPTDKTLTDPEIDALSQKIIAAVGKATGARLRG
jgi:phenylalanyl-tRNA synthetase beta chain